MTTTAATIAAIDSALFTLCRVERRISGYEIRGTDEEPRVCVSVPAMYNLDGDPNSGWDLTTEALYAEIAALFASWREVDCGFNEDGSGEYVTYAL